MFPAGKPAKSLGPVGSGTIGALRDAATADARAQAGAWAAAEQNRESLVHALVSWASNLQPPMPSEFVDTWCDGLPLTADTSDATDLTEVIRSDWYDPTRQRSRPPIHSRSVGGAGRGPTMCHSAPHCGH